MAKISIWLPLFEGSCLNVYQNRYKKTYIKTRLCTTDNILRGQIDLQKPTFHSKIQSLGYFAWFYKHLQPGAMDHHQIWYLHKWFMWGFNRLFILSQFYLTPNEGSETQKRLILLFLVTFSRPANSQPFISYLILSRP